mgnify:CR=1 FL=1
MVLRAAEAPGRRMRAHPDGRWSHRGDPQVIVGLLVDRGGFPLRIGCWEGNRAETTTITGVVEAFQAAHGIAELVIVSGRRHALGSQPDNAG